MLYLKERIMTGTELITHGLLIDILVRLTLNLVFSCYNLGICLIVCLFVNWVNIKVSRVRV